MSEVVVVTPDPEPEPVPINVVVEVVQDPAPAPEVVPAAPAGPGLESAVIMKLVADCESAHARCAALEAMLAAKDAEVEELPEPEPIVIADAPAVPEEPPFDMWKHVGGIL